MKYFFKAFEKYAVFSGRSSRAEYWYFFLFSFIINILLGLIDTEGVVSMIYGLAVLIPSIAVGVRRMHDVNKSGFFLLIPIYNIILLATKSSKGENKYEKTSVDA